MKHTTKQKIYFGVIIVIAVILDQLTKLFINGTMQLHESKPIIQNILHFTLTYNTGATFGLFKDMNILFILLSFAVLLIMLSKYKELPSPKFISAVILGGVIGNLIDRLAYGHVVDFIDFRIWPIFNIADSCITLGTIALLIILVKESVNT